MIRWLTRAAVAAAAMALAAPPAAGAQTLSNVAPGTRVRLSAPTLYNGREVSNTGTWRSGVLQSADADGVTVKLDRDGTVFTFPLSSVQEMQMSRGTLAPGVRWGADARRGLGIGVVAATAVMGISYLSDKEGNAANHCTSNCQGGYTALDKGIFRPTWAHFAELSAAAGATGALVGALLGRTTHREDWVPVTVHAAQLHLGPSGAMVSLRI